MHASVFLASVAGAIVALAVFGGAAASAPVQTTEVRVVTLPIANGFPLDIGIRKGFFAQQGIEIKKTTLQSGNDVVLAMANNNGDIGYLGFVPMFIAVTNNIPMTLVAASEVEGVGQADNWQNILVKGNSSIRTSRDLAGKTIAVNALKGVGEVMIKAALEKQGVRPSSFRLTAIPFPQMRSALNNGQVDAIWVPEPFLSQGLNVDNDRIVMAPGPCSGATGRSAATRRARAGSRVTRRLQSGSARRSTGRSSTRRHIRTRCGRCSRPVRRTRGFRSGAR